MRTDVKLCGQYQKSVLSAKNNFNLYVTSVLFAAVFAAVSEVKLSGRSNGAASSSRIAYNGLQICVCVPRKNVYSKAHRLLAHNANVLLCLVI
jgi:hypothetical protein